MKRANEKVMGAVVLALVLLLTGRTIAGNIDPTNAPGPTMHTLEEIYQKVQDLAPQTLQTILPNTAVVDAGYYAATNLTQVDTDLTAGNIATNVTIFGVVGTLSTNAGGSTYHAAVPKTGQTNSYAAGDDGDLEKGVALPTPRFTDNANGTVTDNATGLIWLKNANGFGQREWATALTDGATLNSGELGLSDGSAEGDWRLPNRFELESLLDLGRYNPALPLGHPFTGVQSGYYWSSSAGVDGTGTAWNVKLLDSYVNYSPWATTCYVWPVRGGQ